MDKPIVFLDYDGVVSSTWRLHDNYKECLYNGGLDNNINIIGKTPFDRIKYKSRYEEILAYMSINNFNRIYVIIDDEYVCDNNNFIFCDGNIGFNEDNMIKAYKLLRK